VKDRWNRNKDRRDKNKHDGNEKT